MPNPPADRDTLQSVGTAPTLTSPLSEGPGVQIGPYKLLTMIGEGGFGCVFLAEQERPVRRRVALKVIKLGMDTRQVVARFEQERQALALMDHPCIAKVLDAGATQTGRPYFVMELVKGDPITSYCDRHHLTVSERLDLLAQVCSAVQHAHAKGVIHRDIKPSNILVASQDGRHQPKVIDFGIAKATTSRLTDKTLFTEHRALIGTPEYMSPEQAQGDIDIDTRADIYSLGVVLYELLTGVTPFDPDTLRAASYDQIQRIIREVEPPRPSTRLQQASSGVTSGRPGTAVRRPAASLRGELDWIVMKAMDKDRQRRYETASDLALDIRRFLAGEPVAAAPPSTTYRVRKFIARNRGMVAAAGIVALALVLGLVGTGLGLIDANRQRARAFLAQQRETDARHTAEQRLEESEATVEFLDSMLAAADPFSGARDVTVRQVLDKAAGSIDERFASRPNVAARLQGTVGRTYLNLGAIAQAEGPLRRQVELRTSTLGPDAPDTRRAVNDLAHFLHTSGQYEQAERFVIDAIAENERLFGRADPITVQSLEVLGTLYTEQGRWDMAEPIIREVLDIRTRTLGPENIETLAAQNSLALMYGETGRTQESEATLRAIVATMLATHGDDTPLAFEVRSNLAWILYWSGEEEDEQVGPERTRQRFLEARAMGEALSADSARVLGTDHQITLNAQNNLSLVYKALGMVDEALELQLQVFEATERALGENHPDLIISLGNLGNMYRDLGRCEEAIPLQQRAIRMARELLPEDDSYGLLVNLAWHGACLRILARYAEAEPIVLEAHQIGVRTLGPDHFITRDQANCLYLLYTAWDEAEPGQGHDAQAARWKPPDPPAP